MSPAGRWPRGLIALRERNYTLYVVGQLVSQLGNWIEATAVAWLLYELTESPLLLGLGGLARAAPLILLALPGGAVADRRPLRTLLLFTESTLLAVSLAVGVLAATDRLAFWHLYILNLISGGLAAFSVPARQALFPGLVPRAAMPSAVVLNAVAVRSAAFLGPSIAGFALATSGYAAPFLLNAASFLGMLLALLAMRLGHLPTNRSAGPSLRQGMVEGVQFVWQNPVLRVVLALEVLIGLFGGNAALVTIVARDVLDAGPQGLGTLLSGLAAGSLVGMLLMVAVHVERRGALILVVGGAYAFFLAGFSRSELLWLSTALLFGVGIADAVAAVTRNTVAQLAVPDALRGRVMSIVVLVTRGSTPLGQVQTGTVAGLAGGPAAALIGAVVVAAGVGLAAWRSPALRALRVAVGDETGGSPPQPAPAGAPAGGGRAPAGARGRSRG